MWQLSLEPPPRFMSLKFQFSSDEELPFWKEIKIFTPNLWRKKV
jgi:hypothetical protein